MPDNAARLLKLAEAEFPDLTEPEREVVRCAAVGENASLAQWGPQPAEGKKRKPGGGPLRSAVVEWLCTDALAKKRVHRKGVRIEFATLDTQLDLERADVPLFFGLYCCWLPGLHAAGTRFGHTLSLNKCHIDGILDICSSHIGGQLQCNGTLVRGAGSTSINADMAEIGNNVYMSKGFRAFGEVCLLGAKIKGQLDCTGGRFLNRNGFALSVENAEIGNNLFLEPKRLRGEICLGDAEVKGTLLIRSESTAEATLDLRGAKVGVLLDSRDSWPEAGRLKLDGFIYGDIYHESPRSAKDRLDWLRRMPSGQFLPQPFEQFAAWLQRTGHDSEAKEVRIAKEWSRFKSFRNPFKMFWWLLKFIFVGFGHKPYYAACWLIGLIVLGSFVYNKNLDLMTPSVSYNFNATEPTEGNAGLQASDYPDLNTLLYSTDVALPIVDLQQERYWMPNSSKPEGRFLWWFNWFEVLFGWFLASMGIAGATGIIRKDK